MVSDGPHGLRKQAAATPTTSASADSVPATCFPPAAALGSSLGRRPARTAWARPSATRPGPATSPCCSVPASTSSASPLCGRNFEYFSEDPVRRGELGAALVRGHPEPGRRHVAQALRGEQPGDRPHARQRRRRRAHPAGDLPRRRSSAWSPGAQPWTVMCAYNQINGMYASEHHWLLTEVLRDEWGFDGLVVSPTGVRCTTASRRSPPGSTCEMPASTARVPTRRSWPPSGTARSTRPCSTSAVGPRLVDCSTRALAGLAEERDLRRRRRPPRARPRGCRRRRRPAQERPGRRRSRCCPLTRVASP